MNDSGIPQSRAEVYAPMALSGAYYASALADMPPDDQERAKKAWALRNAFLEKRLHSSKAQKENKLPPKQ